MQRLHKKDETKIMLLIFLNSEVLFPWPVFSQQKSRKVLTCICHNDDFFYFFLMHWGGHLANVNIALFFIEVHNSTDFSVLN